VSDLYSFAFEEGGAYWTHSRGTGANAEFDLYHYRFGESYYYRRLADISGTALHVEADAGFVAIGTNDSLVVYDTVDGSGYEFAGPLTGFGTFAISVPEPGAALGTAVALLTLAGIRSLSGTDKKDKRAFRQRPMMRRP
jgi:hypothetical protein